jgi:general secretion pathway protein I
VSPSRRERAFTLLEVMVALGLLAAALMATADLAGSALRNHERARDLDVAVLLARGRMAALEERYEDSGFKDHDEEESGDFSQDGRPDVRWRLQVLRPAPDLSADQLIGMLVGETGAVDAGDLAKKLLGAPAAGGSGGPTVDPGPAMAMFTTLLQARLTAFGEALKQSLREMRLTVSWPSGAETRSFTVTTHLVVLNPKAPGGARGDSPDVPPSMAAASAAAAAQRAAAQRAAGALKVKP